MRAEHAGEDEFGLARKLRGVDGHGGDIIIVDLDIGGGHARGCLFPGGERESTLGQFANAHFDFGSAGDGKAFRGDARDREVRDDLRALLNCAEVPHAQWAIQGRRQWFAGKSAPGEHGGSKRCGGPAHHRM